MTTLREYRINLGWTFTQFAKEAGITRQAISDAEAGKQISAVTAKAMADALSKGYGRKIRPTEIEGLQII